MKRTWLLPLLCALLIVSCSRGSRKRNVTPPPSATQPASVQATGPVASAGVLAPTPAAEAEKKSAAAAGADSATADEAAQPVGELLEDMSARPAYGAEQYRLVNQKDEIVSVLKNGLVVIAKRVSSPVVSVRSYTFTGGVYEGQWLGGGLSHLLEHLVAGGSTEKRTEAENRNLLQQLGNNSNAYTTTDHTAYFVNTTPDRMEQAVDLVAGWVFGAKITVPEYRREYQVVQRELEMGKGEPARQFYYLSNANRYRVSPARVPVIGYQEVIQGLSRDDVYNYYKLAYQPQNMLFAIAGDADPEAMLKAVQKHVAEVPPGREFNHDIPAEPPVLAPRTVVATFPKLGQAKLQLAFPSIPLDHPDLYALDLLAQVLGGGDSSLLVEEIRDKRRLVSSIGVSSDTPPYVDGSFEVSMELDPDKIAAATEAVLSVLQGVKAEPLDEQRIERAKTLVKAARVKRLQTAEDIASALATDYISTGDPHFSDRYVERIAQVSPAQVQIVANKYLNPGRLLTTVMLPAEFVGAAGLPKAEELIRPVAPTAEPAPEDPASKVVRAELENGTILLLKRISTSPLIVMNMYALGGLTAEDAETNGLGNLTMQTLPRGTKTRTAQEIAQFFDSIGGDLDTACGNNSWYWNATCLTEDFEEAMEVYADVVNNPSFPDEEVALMKQRVLAAIEGQDADWGSQAIRFFKQKFYGPQNSPYQFMTIGTEENVSGFEPQQMRKWYEEKILQAPRVLAIYGDVDVEKAKALASKLLGAGAKRKPVELVVPEPVKAPAASRPAVTVSKVEVQKTEQPLAGVVIGFRSKSVIGDEANFPLAVADTMTSGYGYPTGYLHEILRGRGLVYVVHAQNVPGRSATIPGSFFVYAGCDPANVNEVVETIIENIARVQGTPADVNADWFQRSKELAVVSEAMERETPSQQATAAALDELYGLGYDYHQKFPQFIRKVELDDVRTVARARLSQCVVTVSTPNPDAVKVKSGKREFESFPEVDLTPRGIQHDTAGGP